MWLNAGEIEIGEVRLVLMQDEASGEAEVIVWSDDGWQDSAKVADDPTGDLSALANVLRDRREAERERKNNGATS